MKKVILPGDPALSDLPATDNTGLLIVRLLDTMPLGDRLALGIRLGARAVRVRTDPANLEQAIAAEPVETLRQAKRRFTDAALRQRELDERDACYRELARTLPPARSGYAMARAMQTLLKRYRDRGPWRFERGRKPPADPVRALMHRTLTLDNGAIRSRFTIERAVAGIRSKSPE